MTKQTTTQLQTSSNSAAADDSSAAQPIATEVLPAPKRGPGQPSKYDPSFCAIAIECGKRGLSREAISSELGISWRTLNEWAHVHPEFDYALEEAKKEELLWFERLGQAHLVEVPQGARLNTGLWSRSVAARFPHKYRENSKVEVTGKDDKPIEIDVLHDFSQELVNQLLATRQIDVKSNDRS